MEKLNINNTPIPNVEAKPEVKQGSAIEAIKRLIADKKEKEIFHITPEEVEKASGVKIDEFMEFIKGERIEISTNFEDLFKIIDEALSETEEPSKEGLLRKITNNKYLKASFVALMLFLKFGQTSASTPKESNIEKNDGGKNKTETVTPVNIEPDNSPDTYYLDQNDFKHLKAMPLEINVEKNDRYFELELGNYFDNDSDNIPKESLPAIKSAIVNLLSEINHNNINEVIENGVTIYAHSNELPTSNWDGKNENLSKARAESLTKIIREVFKNYENMDLNPKDLEKIKNIKINIKVANFEGHESGVLPLTELINDDTGQKYTQSEIKEIKEKNPNLYNKLLAKARGVELIIQTHSDTKIGQVTPKGVKIEPSPKNIEKITLKPVFENLSNYGKVVLAFDNSPSTGNDNIEKIAKTISSQQTNGNQEITCMTYSNKIDNSRDFDNLDEVYNFVKNIDNKGKTKEKALRCIYDFLKHQPKTEKNVDDQKENVYLFWTDENLQDVSKELIEKINKLAEEKNYKIYGYITDPKDKTISQYSLEEIEKALDESLMKVVSPKINQMINQYDSKILSLEKQAEKYKNDLEKIKDNNLKEEVEEKINEIEKTLHVLQYELDQLTSDYESGSISKLFENKIIKEKIGIGEKGLPFNEKLARNIKMGGHTDIKIDLASL